MTDWIKVQAIFDTPPPDWALVIEAFDAHGCPGTLQEDDPPSMSAYLAEVSGSHETANQLRDALMGLGACEVVIEKSPDEAWEELWKQNFAPRRIGRRIRLRPSWEEPSQEAGIVEIALDPGRAFGTGEHPTTRLCLAMLEEVPLGGKSVLDLGCGSGILAIGAALLGAGRVDAVDIDPTSIEVARENAERNYVAVDFRVGDGVPDGGRWDVIVSNIISATLIRLAPTVAAQLNDGGIWIVSGVLSANYEDVRRAAERVGFTMLNAEEEDEWVAMRFQR